MYGVETCALPSCDAKQIKGQVDSLRKEIEKTTSDYEKEKLQERHAKLAGGVAVVKVGAHTETEMMANRPTPDRVPVQEVHQMRMPVDIGHGDVLIAAITSCTNTSNPSVMLTAGLLAKKAIEKGLHVRPEVKTSLAPGSRVVSRYY